ncbi:hypothetical protein WJ968_00600 [Achromobacter xylosoxidans]
MRSSLSGGRLRGAGQAAVRVQQPFAPGMDGVVRRQQFLRAGAARPMNIPNTA